MSGYYDSASAWRAAQAQKEGRRFSAASQEAMASHTRAVRQAADAHAADMGNLAKHLTSMSGNSAVPYPQRSALAQNASELRRVTASHLKRLYQAADDLDALWQEQGQGDAYAEAARSTGSLEYKAAAGGTDAGRSTFNERLAERKLLAAGRHAASRERQRQQWEREAALEKALAPLHGGSFSTASENQVRAAATRLAAVELSLLAGRRPGPGRF